MEKPQDYWTVETYLAYEQESGIKHEYIDGEIFAMAGGLDKHSLIKTNCVIELGLQLRGKSCRLYDSDMKVEISDIKYVYPDFTVACGEAKFDDEAHTMLVNPTLVAEVTSPSTESYDVLTKANFYRNLPSVQAYLIIDQEKVHAQLFTRQGKGWFFQEFSSHDEKILLDVIACTLPVSEVYRDINFPES